MAKIDLSEISSTESRILTMDTPDMIRTIGTTDKVVLMERKCSRSFIALYLEAVETHQKKIRAREMKLEAAREEKRRAKEDAIKEARKRLGWSEPEGDK
jgi:hypothetical protein